MFEIGEYLFLHTGLGYLRFYPGIENLILPIIAPDKAAYCVFTQLLGPQNAI